MSHEVARKSVMMEGTSRISILQWEQPGMCKDHIVIYRFNAIPIKLPTVFFIELKQIISEFVWKHKKNLKEPKQSWERRMELEESTSWFLKTTYDFRLYYKTTVIKTVWYWHKDKNIDQWNKIESPEINPCTYRHLIFDRRGKNIQGRKAISLTSGAGKTGQPHVKEWI